MKILSRRSELQKRLRIAEMLREHALKNQQPQAAQRYHRQIKSIHHSLGSVLGWITRSSRTY